MADEEIQTRKLVVTQPKGDAFAVSGDNRKDPLSHRHIGEVTHRTEKPLVHMVCWDADSSCEVNARIEVVGDEKRPVAVQHRFPDAHPQTHSFKTALAEPVHHALQMRTPLQVRFCNSWHVASNYAIDLDLAGRRWMSIRIAGATVATPQPCPDENCGPVITHKPIHP
jgi:hypothetical protein